MLTALTGCSTTQVAPDTVSKAKDAFQETEKDPKQLIQSTDQK